MLPRLPKRCKPHKAPGARGGKAESDATDEASRVQGLAGIELMFYGPHEWQGVAGIAPGVKVPSQQRTAESHERTPGPLHSFAEDGGDVSDVLFVSAEKNRPEARRLNYRVSVDERHAHGGEVGERGDRIGGKGGDFQERRIGLLSSKLRVQFATGSPRRRGRFPKAEWSSKSFELHDLRGNSLLRSFEENIDEGFRSFAVRKPYLQRRVCELRIQHLGK